MCVARNGYAEYVSTVSSFFHDGHRLVYEEYGTGDRVVVLVHGVLLSRSFQAPLAQAIADQGFRVVSLDVLGHGESDRPKEMWNYSMHTFGGQILALLDHLGVHSAVLAGSSLGANASLEAAVRAPDRVRGLLIEMPVLDNALLAVAAAFTPLLVGLTFGAPLSRPISKLIGKVPRRLNELGRVGRVGDIVLEAFSQDPKPAASVLQGLFFGRVAPPRAERRMITAPTLVIGHPRDPIHPFSDVDMLVREIPGAQLLHASSILELRTNPEKLAPQIATFLRGCYKSARVSRVNTGRKRSNELSGSSPSKAAKNTRAARSAS